MIHAIMILLLVISGIPLLALDIPDSSYTEVGCTPIFEYPYYDCERTFMLAVVSFNLLQDICNNDPERKNVYGCYIGLYKMDFILLSEDHHKTFRDNCNRSVLHHEMMHLKYYGEPYDPTHEIKSKQELCRTW